MATPGELWSLVEPVARAQGGWVAFAPRAPQPMMVRSLVTGSSTPDDLSAHICTAEHARNILDAGNIAASAVAELSTDPNTINPALAASRASLSLWSDLGDSYLAADIIASKDVGRVVRIVLEIDRLVKRETLAVGDLELEERSKFFYELVDLRLRSPTCGPRPKRWRWWLIPLALIGTSLVVYSETKERRRK